MADAQLGRNWWRPSAVHNSLAGRACTTVQWSKRSVIAYAISDESMASVSGYMEVLLWLLNTGLQRSYTEHSSRGPSHIGRYHNEVASSRRFDNRFLPIDCLPHDSFIEYSQTTPPSGKPFIDQRVPLWSNGLLRMSPEHPRIPQDYDRRASFGRLYGFHKTAGALKSSSVKFVT